MTMTKKEDAVSRGDNRLILMFCLCEVFYIICETATAFE